MHPYLQDMPTHNGVGCCSTNQPQFARIHGSKSDHDYKTFERSFVQVLLRSSVHGAAARRTGKASAKPTAETAKIHSVVQKMNFHAELVTASLGKRIKSTAH